MSFKNQTVVGLLAAATTSLALASCRPASYELIRLTKSQDTGQGDPKQVVPPGTHPGELLPKPPIDGNVLPTARVEVFSGSESVVRVRAGEPVSIRPTWDTLDPDDIGRSACANPGIVRADYDIANQWHPSVQRNSGCEPLAVAHTFATPGDYPITMTVTSNDGEIAVARLVLTVIPADAPRSGAGLPDAGFTVKAEPMLAKARQIITFTGRCVTNNPATIRWTFADGATAEGRVATHSYAETGQYPVTAQCIEAGGRQLEAQVTIVIIDQHVEIPGQPAGPEYSPEQAGNDGSGGTPGQQGSNGPPVQTGPVIPTVSRPCQPCVPYNPYSSYSPYGPYNGWIITHY